MDKSERLIAILDYLRRHRRPVTGDAMAEEFGVSVRTIYRDMQTLIGLGAPLDGEAGVGYILRPGFFLPPLMFSVDELEALVLGARWVQDQPDSDLSRAAENAIGKIATAAPEDLRDRIGNIALWPVLSGSATQNPALLTVVREALREEQVLQLAYADEQGNVTHRDIWPVALAFFQHKHIVAAWCELRQAFRHFRIDRIESAVPAGRRYSRRRSALLKAWQAEIGIDL